MNQDETDKSALEQDWPDALDAMVTAPDHHEILLENERVRVLDSRIKPGETVPVHTHRWASVLYVLGTSDFIRYDTAREMRSSIPAPPQRTSNQEQWCGHLLCAPTRLRMSVKQRFG